MPRPTGLVLFSAATVAAAACAGSSRYAGSPDPNRRCPASREVTVSNGLGVTVDVYDGTLQGSRSLLGSVDGGMTTTFRLPVESSGHVRAVPQLNMGQTLRSANGRPAMEQVRIRLHCIGG